MSTSDLSKMWSNIGLGPVGEYNIGRGFVTIKRKKK